MIRAIVIGANGFCGRHLVRRLADVEGAEVVGVDVHADSFDPGKVVAYISRDIAEPDAMKHIVAGAEPKWVFNLAGLTSGSPSSVYSANTLGPIRLLDAVREHAPDASVVLVGSAAEYGIIDAAALPVTEDTPCHPVGDYGISKHAMTTAVLDITARRSLKVVVARPFNIIGAGVPRSLVVGAIISRAHQALGQAGNPVVKVGNLDTQRDFIDAEDVVNAYISMAKGDSWGEVYNICSGRPVAIRDVVTIALSNSPKPIKLEVDPALVRPSDCPIAYGSFDKAKRAFGFEPKVTLEESLKRAWDHATP